MTRRTAFDASSGFTCAVPWLGVLLTPIGMSTGPRWLPIVVLLAVVFAGLLANVARAVQLARAELLVVTLTDLIGILGVFVWIDWAVGLGAHNAFSEHMSKPDAIYYVASVVSTTGFGDITPLSATARMVTTAQMLLDVVAVVGILGLATSFRRRPARAALGEGD